MKITFLGHASLQIKIGQSMLLVDPFISGNPKAEAIDVSALEADYILVTHAHQDHILDVESIAKLTGAKIISNFEIVTHYQNLGRWHSDTPKDSSRCSSSRCGNAWRSTRC